MRTIYQVSTSLLGARYTRAGTVKAEFRVLSQRGKDTLHLRLT
jgi:hypothetical protein